MTNGSRKYHLWGNSSGFFHLNVPFYLLFHLFHTLTSFSPLYYSSGIHSYSALLGCCCNLAFQTSYTAALYQSDQGFSLEAINASLSLVPQYCEVSHNFPVDTVLHNFPHSPKKSYMCHLTHCLLPMPVPQTSSCGLFSHGFWRAFGTQSMGTMSPSPLLIPLLLEGP